MTVDAKNPARVAVVTFQALVHAAGDALRRLICPGDQSQIERIAALLGAAATAAAQALQELDRTAAPPTAGRGPP